MIDEAQSYEAETVASKNLHIRSDDKKRLLLYISILVVTRCCMYRLQRKINQKHN